MQFFFSLFTHFSVFFFLFLSFENYSFMWCGLCHLYTVCNWTDNSSVHIVHSAFNGSSGRPDDWTIGVEKLRAKIARTTYLVDCAGRLFGMHYIRNRIQFIEHNHRTEIGRKRGSTERTVTSWFRHMKMKTMVRTVNEWMNARKAKKINNIFMADSFCVSGISHSLALALSMTYARTYACIVGVCMRPFCKFCTIRCYQ